MQSVNGGGGTTSALTPKQLALAAHLVSVYKGNTPGAPLASTPPPFHPSFPQQRAMPISPVQAQLWAAQPHPSLQDVRANAIAAQAVKALQPVIAASRAVAPGPGVSGYRFLSAALGPNLAAQLPGTLTAEGQSPHPSVSGTVRDLAMLSPYLRGDRAIYRTAKALIQAKPLGEVVQAAKVRRPWLGVADRAGDRTAQPRVNKQGRLRFAAGTNYTSMTSGWSASMVAGMKKQMVMAKAAATAKPQPQPPKPAALVGMIMRPGGSPLARLGVGAQPWHGYTP